ncbi:hypothetical protein [Nesterenkonia ebinurensis]|uniref:hypothetical protein n=1 Tax=Nesterenkonia ebinurensis TaxID=2608252 RepID=UPI001CC7F827|nr:hypothetical protein [Nesterenkonia ebinurensis]
MKGEDVEGWAVITEAIGVALSGEKGQGHKLLLESWRATASSNHAQRCVLAHYLADTEEELAKEVAWDEAALGEYRHLEEDSLASIGVTSARGFEPSLRLNLADGYHRLDKLEAAREQLAAGQACAAVLGNDGYGNMIRTGLSNLAQRMEATGNRKSGVI